MTFGDHNSYQPDPYSTNTPNPNEQMPQPAYGSAPYGQPTYGQPTYGQPGYPYNQGIMGSPVRPLGTNPLAIASIICSTVGSFFCGIGGIVGLILGIIAMKEIKKTGQEGHGMALAGTIIGGIVIFFLLVYIVFFGIFAASR